MRDIGLTEQEERKLTDLLARYPMVEKAVVYGSRAKGNHRKFSDIDLTLCGQTLSISDLNKIDNAIDNLLLPYDVDLSIFDKLKNKALIEHIKRVGITIYTKKHEE